MVSIAKLFPVQFIGPESHRLFCEGPKIRRQFLDWGLFHVEQPFFSLWQQFQHTLKQRNACLKARASFNEVTVWDKIFVESATLMDNLRKKYTDSLKTLFFCLFDTIFNQKSPD